MPKQFVHSFLLLHQGSMTPLLLLLSGMNSREISGEVSFCSARNRVLSSWNRVHCTDCSIKGPTNEGCLQRQPGEKRAHVAKISSKQSSDPGNPSG